MERNSAVLLCLRDCLGLTNRDCAEIAGTTERTVSRWMTGRFNPPNDFFEALLDIQDDIDVLVDDGTPDLEIPQGVTVAIPVFRGNADLRRWGQPMPGRGHAAGGFAATHRIAIMTVAEVIEDEFGAEVRLVIFDADNFTRWALANNVDTKGGAAVARWAAECVT